MTNMIVTYNPETLKFYQGDVQFCKCGCGQLVKPNNKFVLGHNARVKEYSGWWPEKGNIPWNKGKKGLYVPWNKGLSKDTDERVKISAERTSRTRLNKARDGTLVIWNRGIKLPFTIWNKGKKGCQVPWNKGLSAKTNDVVRRMADMRRGIAHPTVAGNKNPSCYPGIGKKISSVKKSRWIAKSASEKEACIRSWLSNIPRVWDKPNKLEQVLWDVLNEVLPGEYRYNDGWLIIGGKIPDFSNVNGQKKLIEFYGNYWHRDDNPQDRINLFKQFGYDTLIIWGSELEDGKSLINKILEFHDIKPRWVDEGVL